MTTKIINNEIITAEDRGHSLPRKGMPESHL